MESGEIRDYILSSGHVDLKALEYFKRLRKTGGYNMLVLHFFPLFLLISWSFFPDSIIYLPSSLAVYLALIGLLLRQRYHIDSEFRGFSCSFSYYARNFPVSWTYLKYVIFTITILAALMIALHLALNWYEGLALLLSIIVITFSLLVWTPYYNRMLKHSRKVESERILSPLRKITENEGMKDASPAIIEGTNFRIANAFCVGILRDRVCITDYLLDNITEEESVAMIAHELGHLKMRHNLKMVIPTLIAFVIGGAFALFLGLLAAGYLNFNVYKNSLPALVALVVMGIFTGVFFPTAFLRRRTEDQADRFAVKHLGSENLIKGLIKAQKLNLIPLNFRGSHAPLGKRIEKLKRYEAEFKGQKES